MLHHHKSLPTHPTDIHVHTSNKPALWREYALIFLIGTNGLAINWLNLFLCPSCLNWMFRRNGLTILSSCWFGLLELPPHLLSLLYATVFLLGSLSMVLFIFFEFRKKVKKRVLKKFRKCEGEEVMLEKFERKMKRWVESV